MPVQQLTLTLNPNIYFAQTTHRNRKQLYVKPPPSALDMTLPAFAAEHGRMQEISIDSWYATPAPGPSIDISCAQGAQQQTIRTPLLLSYM